MPLNELQNRMKNLRLRLKGLPLQGQILDNIGKGRLLGMLQGRRLLQGTFPFAKGIYPQNKATHPQKKLHSGVVDTSDIGRGKPLTTELSVEREKSGYPVNMEMAIEM